MDITIKDLKSAKELKESMCIGNPGKRHIRERWISAILQLYRLKDARKSHTSDSITQLLQKMEIVSLVLQITGNIATTSCLIPEKSLLFMFWQNTMAMVLGKHSCWRL